MEETKKTPVIFFGSEEVSLIILKKVNLLPYLKIVGVVTKPPRPAGRKQIITPTVVEKFARQENLPVFTPEKIDQTFCQTIIQQKPVLGILAAYGKIIPQELIDIFPRGIINVHPSLLPQFRGATPVVAAILSGQKTTGVSLFLIDKLVDHGPIMAQEKLNIENNDDQLTLTRKLFLLGGKLLEKALKKYLDGQLELIKQNHDLATFTSLLTRQDGEIKLVDLQKALRGDKISQEIEKKIRAFHPWPGTYTLLDNQRVKIIKAHLEENSLKIDRLQFAGKNPINWNKQAENLFLK